MVQSMPDASPVRWHLAHTTWFFETFVLKAIDPNHQPFEPAFETLFNSYYNTVGKPFPRAQRGLLSRPSLADVYYYRQAVDEQIFDLLASWPEDATHLLPVVELGLHHEQQHQELIATDLKHMLSLNPLAPVYCERESNIEPKSSASSVDWIEGANGIRSIGHEGDEFSYDNESPHHATLLRPHQIASRPVTNAEYLEFIEAGGYQEPKYWLSIGWQTVCDNVWTAPLYWQRGRDSWMQFTLAGLLELEPDEPVCHVSFFEADAYGRWSGARLPSEAEWEVAAVGSAIPASANFIESGRYHPQVTREDPGKRVHGLYGNVWEWTASPYTAYPGYSPPAGAIGEYNGKFMCNQYVLRGGSCVTSRSHIRPTYRNFFSPSARWQFTGIRLAS